MYLMSLAYDKPKRWLELFSWAELWQNSTYNVSIGMTPFFALYGREAATFIEIQRGKSTNVEIEDKVLRRQDILELVKIHFDKTQDKMKIQANKHRTHIEF